MVRSAWEPGARKGAARSAEPTGHQRDTLAFRTSVQYSNQLPRTDSRSSHRPLCSGIYVVCVPCSHIVHLNHCEQGPLPPCLLRKTDHMWLLHRGRPWEMVLVVYGFPTQVLYDSIPSCTSGIATTASSAHAGSTASTSADSVRQHSSTSQQQPRCFRYPA